MKTKFIVMLLCSLWFFSCKVSDTRDYSNMRVTLYNDSTEKPVDVMESGESLVLQFDGLEPNAPIQAYLLDEKGNEWSYARMYADLEGKVHPFLFWYQSGVIGGTSRETKFTPEPAFKTFEEAEAYFMKNSLRLELRDLEGETLKRIKIPFKKRTTAFVYPSNDEGILWNAFDIDKEDTYITGKGFPSNTDIHLYLVPNQYQWNIGDSIQDVRGKKQYLKTIKVQPGKNSFTTKVAHRGEILPGTYDIIARVGGNAKDLQFNNNDILSYNQDTAIVLYMIVNGNIVIDVAGRMKGATAKFEFSDAFEKGENVYGAVDPTDVPAVHAGGNYAAYYVVEDQNTAYWDAATAPALVDVSGGIEIQRVKYWCINASRRLIWPNATQPEPIKGYDVVVDFGSTPAMTSADFVQDDEYDKGLDFIDGYNDVGFYVLEDPATTGALAVGEVTLDDPNGISGITDPTGATGPAYPVNLAWAKIMYPANTAGSGVPVSTSSSNYPLVLFLHGNHAVCDSNGASLGGSSTGLAPCASNANRIPNHEGYNYIMERLASQGFIAISISAHQINLRSDARNYESRGRLVLKYLEKLKDWNDNGTDPFGGIFQNKIDMTKIGLSGHSRGGEGVVAAAELNNALSTPFNIMAVNAIAPTDLNSSRGTNSFFNIQDNAFFLLLGARDGDVWDLQGNRMLDRAYRTSSTAPINDKMATNVYGANHNYFNTVWTNSAALGTNNPWASARDDYYYGGVSDVMSGADQRNVGNSLICAFFRRYLKGVEAYKEIFTNRIELSNLPNDKLIMTYQDKSRLSVDHFENTPTNATTNSLGGTIAYTGFTTNSEIHMNQANSDYTSFPTRDSRYFHSTLGLKLTWTSNATYETNIPAANKDVSAYEYLSFRVTKALPGATGTGSLNLLINIEDGSGNQARWDLQTEQFNEVPHPYRKNRPSWAGGGAVDMISLSTVRIPLRNFTMNNSNVDLTDIEKIIIKTTGASEIGLDDLEFTN